MQQIQALSDERSSGTTLISYYLKGNTPRSVFTSLLAKERSISDNIKSKTTRKAVLAAIKAIQAGLREFNTVPENGLAVFSGNGQFV